MSTIEATFGMVDVTLYTEPVGHWGRCGFLQQPERPYGELEALVYGGTPEGHEASFSAALEADWDDATDWALSEGFELPEHPELAEPLEMQPGTESPLATYVLRCTLDDARTGI